VPAQSGRTKAWVLFVLLLLLAVVGGVSYLGWRQSAPGVRAPGALPRLVGQKTAFTVVLEAARGNVAQAEVRVAQGGKPAVAARLEGARGRRVELPVTLDTAALGLREGGATLEVWARDDFWRPLRFEDRPLQSQAITVDLTPPKVEVLAATQYLAQGGAGLVAFRAQGAVRATVMLGDLPMPSFPVGSADQGARVALIALPWNLAPGAPLRITAQDEAGNVATRGIAAEIKARRFPRDRIELKDAFLQVKVPELLPQHPAGRPLIEGFLVVNRDLRAQAEAQKRKVGTTTAETPLWDGRFTQPRNTKVFANFAETRTYVHDGQEVDTQVHFGFDLASTRQSAVPAANAGAVAFAGPLTIYGNTVILDHGWGLQTLYAHLSRIDVKVGDAVEKGQELGRTGTTGLSGGDHLHFEVLVHGVSVTPLEWWDARWLRDHIAKPLAEAGLPAIAGLDAPVAEPASPRRRVR
jgi:hypothetical protein